MHTAMLLGAAQLLLEHEKDLQVTVKLCFQPGEETLSGALCMIDAGLLSSPDVDCAMMIHVLRQRIKSAVLSSSLPRESGLRELTFSQYTYGERDATERRPISALILSLQVPS